VHDALQNDDGGFFLARMRTQHVVCTPEDLVPRGPGGPPCTEAGQELDVIPIGGWLSEGADVSREDALGALSVLWQEEAAAGQDSYGGPGAQVYAIGLWDDPEYQPAYVTLATAIITPDPRPSDDLRVVFALIWVGDGGGYELVRILQTRSLQEALLEPLKMGRASMPIWERFGP
jgi:hypothetical protein